MADQDRYSKEPRDRLGQRDVYMDNRTGVGAQSKGYHAEWGRGANQRDGDRYGDREQSYNQRRGENASFSERDYGQSDGGRTGYRGYDDESRYGYGGAQGRGSSETYGQGRYSQSNSRYAAGDQQSREAGWADYMARSNPDFYADQYGAAGPGWAEDFTPGRDRSLESYRGQGREQAYNRGSDRYGLGYTGARPDEPDYRGRDQGRGFWDKAADRVASWFGGEETYQGRESHRGKGPKGYRRSDERIREDVSDRLTDDHWLDASNIEVRVESTEVILTGEVKTRDDKRRAEQLAEQVIGVENVQNHLRLEKPEDRRFERSAGGTGASTTIPGSNDLGAKTGKTTQ